MLHRRNLIRFFSSFVGSLGLPWGNSNASAGHPKRDLTDEIQAAIDTAHDHAFLPCFVYFPDGSYRLIKTRQEWQNPTPPHCTLCLSRFGIQGDPIPISRPLRIPGHIAVVGPIALDASKISGPCIEVDGPSVTISSISIILGPNSTHAINKNGWNAFVSSVDEHVA